jgi:nicotinamidase/pyrazinamidase
MKKVGLFLIDLQQDFMDSPGSALPVAGANDDAVRAANFITKFADQITGLYLTQDSHHRLDISHRWMWKVNKGLGANDPFIDANTLILPENLADGSIYAVVNPGKQNKYVRDLTDQGEYMHFIWTDHCVVGTPGHAFHPEVSKAMWEWEVKTGHFVSVITKGWNPWTEHFGAIRANIPQGDDQSTQLNQTLLNQLLSNDLTLFGGEAQTHCDANTIKQLCEEAPALLPKLVILEDLMSPVVGVGLPQAFYDGVDAIYAKAKSMGAQFAKTTDFTTKL